MARPYPAKLRDDVVRVARNRDDGVTIEQIATDFWSAPDDAAEMASVRPTSTKAPSPARAPEESGELREARRRIKLLEQENEVLRRAAAYLSQANLPCASTRS